MIYPKTLQIVYLDSTGLDGENIIKIFREFFNRHVFYDKDLAVVKVKDLPLQGNGYDCGVYVCKFAEEFSQSNDIKCIPKFTKIQDERNTILSRIKNRKINRDPADSNHIVYFEVDDVSSAESMDTTNPPDESRNRDNRLLSTDYVNFSMRNLANEVTKRGTESIALNCTFLQNILEGKMKRADINLKMDNIIIPVLLPGHWALVMIYPQKRQIVFLDSLNETGAYVTNKFKEFFDEQIAQEMYEKNSFEVMRADSRQQTFPPPENDNGYGIIEFAGKCCQYSEWHENLRENNKQERNSI